MLISDAKSQVMEPEGFINLNPGSCSPVQKEVYAELIRQLTQQCQDPTEFIFSKSFALIEKGRTALGAFLNCDPKDLVLCTNASHGINSILQTYDWKAGDEILTTDQEYHHYQMLFKTLVDRHGIKIVKVNLPLVGRTFISTSDYNDSVLDLFRSKKTLGTKAIFFSHITSPIGQRLPAKELCSWAKTESLMSIVDGAHGPGHIPVNIDDMKPDFYIANLHKWVMNPAGCAFLYAAPAVRFKFKPLIVMAGYGVLAEGRDRLNALGTPIWAYAHEYLGTTNVTPMTVLWKTLEEFQKIGVRAIETAWKENRAKLVTLLESLKFEIVSPANPDSGSCLIAAKIPVPGSKIDTIRARNQFRSQHKIELAFPTLEDGTSLIRISAAWFANEKQFDYLASVLKEFDWQQLRHT